MEELQPVLMRGREEPTTLRKVSSPPHVVAGSRAVVKRGVMQRQALAGQRRGLKQARPHCSAFSLFLFRDGVGRVFWFGFNGL